MILSEFTWDAMLIADKIKRLQILCEINNLVFQILLCRSFIHVRLIIKLENRTFTNCLFDPGKSIW